MKRLFLYITIIFIALKVGHLAANAQIKYLSYNKIKSIQSEFRHAKAINKSNLEKISDKMWTCHLLGMRSRMDIGKKLDLYRLEKLVTKNKIRLSNTGAQMIKNYKPTKIGLYGSIGPYFDLVRINKKGQLISELSIKGKKLSKRDVKSVFFKKKKAVVSYAICNS